MDASSQTVSAASRALVARETQELRRNLQTPLPAPRIDLERKISLRFPHFQGFLTEYSSNISITGMFVRSNEPQPPGTILDFEFNLIDGLKLIRGTGEVVWMRLVDEGPDLPTGMGIRFLRLDAESRRLIRWAVEKQIDQGTELFQLQRKPAEDRIPEQLTPPVSHLGSAAAGPQDGRPAEKIDTGRLYPFAGYAVARRTPWRRRLSTVGAGTLAAALVALAGYASLAQRSSAPAARAFVLPAAVETSTATAKRPAEQQLIEATFAWAQAWSEQRPEDYLALYSPRFSPPDSASRDRWEAQRRQRIRRPRFIQVAIGGLEVELLSADRGRVTFDQTYSSDTFSDRMRKTLEMVREDGRWLIAAELGAG